MNITYLSSRNTETQDVKVTMGVSGAEPRPIYKGGKRMWRPERIAITWTRSRVNDGPWSPWGVEGAITGPFVRKDGAAFGGEYNNSNTEHIYGLYRLPAEFAETVLATRPNGDMPAYFRREADAVELDV